MIFLPIKPIKQKTKLKKQKMSYNYCYYCTDGDKNWVRNGEYHRDDGLPAIETATGTKIWYVNGERHREGGLPAIEYANGTKQWWVMGIDITKFR